MDPISMSATTQTYATQEPPVPAAPDASDVQEFQNLYGQEGPAKATASAPTFQTMVINQMGGPAAGVITDNVFQAAMSRMMELHDKSCAKIETLIDRLGTSEGLSPSQMLEAQIVLADATTGLATYQSFDKKTDEGIKALMTGQ